MSLTVTPDVSRETDVPSIPEPTQQNLGAVVRAIKDIMDVREGVAGDPLDQVVTYRELFQRGKLDRSFLDGKPMVRLPGVDAMVFLPIPNGEPDYARPPAPTGLVVTPTLANMLVQWDKPSYHGHAFTEVWRSGVNDLGTATKVGTEDAVIYGDKLNQTGLTRYYWIRHVSKAGSPGPYNATAGTGATTGKVGTTDVTDASMTISKIKARRIELSGDVWTDNSPGAGSVAWNAHTLVFDGTTYTVAAGSASNKWIYWDLASPGTYSATSVFPSLTDTQFLVATNVAGAHDLVWNANGVARIIIGDTALLGDLVVGTANIQLLAVQNGQIGNLAVDNSKILNLNASKITAGDIDAARMQVNALTALQATVTQLSAIRADMGAITAGTITLSASGHIKAGQTAYDTGTGFFAGISGGVPVMSLGSSTKGFTWDNSVFTIRGAALATTFTAGTGTDVAVLDGADATYRIYAGHSTAASAPFSVKKDGTVTIKSATSGARLEIVTDTIRVYDSGGTLRVKLGNLA